VLHHPYRKEVLLHVCMELRCSSFRPLFLVLLLCGTKKNLASSICLPPTCWHLQTLIQSPLSLLFHRLNRPRLFSLSSYGRCSRPLIIFVALCWTASRRSLSVLMWGPRTGHSILNMASLGQSRMGESPPLTCWPPLAFLASRAHCSKGTCCPGPSLQSSSTAGHPLFWTDECHYSFPGASLYTCSC